MKSIYRATTGNITQHTGIGTWSDIMLLLLLLLFLLLPVILRLFPWKCRVVSTSLCYVSGEDFY